MARKNTKREDGVTYHRCKDCGGWFQGSGKRGRPYRRCFDCRPGRNQEA